MRIPIRHSLALKLSLAFALFFIGMLLIVMLIVRHLVTSQFVSEHQSAVARGVQAVSHEFSQEHARISTRLVQQGRELESDHSFRRLAAVSEDYSASYLLTYATQRMGWMGLDALHILDSQGRIVSSGHFPDESGYGSDRQAELARYLQLADTMMVSAFETLDDKFYAVSVCRKFRSQGNSYYLVGGGRRITDETLSSIVSSGAISLTHEIVPVPDLGSGENSDAGDVLSLPLVDGDTDLRYVFRVNYSSAELTALLDKLNFNLLWIGIIGSLLAISIGIWQAHRLSKPLADLAAGASMLSLDQLEVSFSERGAGETTMLARALNKMVRGLRSSRVALTRAEEQAARGEIARQVNHDIKNGFIPIRNIMDHWEEVSASEPAQLPKIFEERKKTVRDSILYLEEMARTYSRMKPEIKLADIEINKAIQDLISQYENLPDMNVEYSFQSAKDVMVRADKMLLRRAFENILRNSIEAMDGNGKVSVNVEIEKQEAIISWSDTGAGVPASVQKKLFAMPYTTKSTGTGLGLTNVKRIIEDFGGHVKLESEAGQGTTIWVVLPVR